MLLPLAEGADESILQMMLQQKKLTAMLPRLSCGTAQVWHGCKTLLGFV